MSVDIRTPIHSYTTENSKKDDLKNECKDCKYGKTCKGGCSFVPISLTGITHSDPYCLRSIEKSKFSR